MLKVNRWYRKVITLSILLLLLSVMGGNLYHPRPAYADFIIMVNTVDGSGTVGDGFCSLSEAINAANANDGTINDCPHDGSSGTDTIRFDPSITPTTITLAADLPPIIDPVIIEGGGGVTINGGGSITTGLFILMNNITIRGLTITGFISSGIHLDGTNNTIGGTGANQGNVISGNGNGIHLGGGVTNTISNNVISDNTYAGISIQGNANGNTISGNRIGTNAAGTGPLANGYGVMVRDSAWGNIIGGLTPAARNIISGNTYDGVYIGDSVSTTQISGNYIGTDAAGTAAVPNGRYGVHINNAQSNYVGVSAANAGNVISGNGSHGVYIAGANASNNYVMGNRIGTNAAGDTALPNGGDGVTINGAQKTLIGGAGADERNTISGNGQNGIVLTGAGASGNMIYGNRIGTNAAGTAAIPNGQHGVYLLLAPSNYISGTFTYEGNVISGNGGDGIRIESADSNWIHNNLIGTNRTGTGALANGGNGVYLNNASYHDLMSNVISGNTGGGIRIQGGTTNRVYSNSIGTDSTGTGALANGGDGVAVINAPNNNIGALGRNIISGNTGNGLSIQGTISVTNMVMNNYIGTNVAGDTAIPNVQSGVAISNGASTNTIGGSAAANRNIISGNTGDGISINGTSANNVVLNNYIGTNAAGTGALPNQYGVAIYNSSTTTVGYNTISGNRATGVYIGGASATGNRLYSNAIGTNSVVNAALANGGYGIGISEAPSNVIAPNNIISGNSTGGVYVAGAADNTVASNTIGTNAAGLDLRNSGPGITLSNVPSGIINSNTIRYNTVGIFNEGSSPSLSGNTITTNLGHGISNRVYMPANDPLSVGGQVAAQASIVGNTISGNCTAGPASCAGIYSLDVLPSNDVPLWVSNISGDNNGAPWAEARFYGAVELISGGAPVAGSVTLTSSSGGPSYTLSTASTCPAGTLNGTVLLGPAGMNCNDITTWTPFLLYRIATDGTRTTYTPQQAGGRSYSFDGNAATDPTNTTGVGFDGEGLTSGVFSRYQIMEIPAPATQLAFTTQPPTSSLIAAPITVQVSIQDAMGNVVDDDTTVITLDLSNNPGGATWGGALTATAVNGVASFTFSLDHPGVGYTLTASASGLTSATSNTFTITLPTLTLSSGPTVTEGNSGTTNADFTVTLSSAVNAVVTVNYATGDVNTTADTDYTATSGTLTFAINDPLTKTISVPVIGDTLDELNETFTLTISTPTNAILGVTTSATGTIMDDDGAPSLSMTGVTVNEGNSGTTDASFTVTLSPTSAQVVTVNYATSDGTAAAGSDYTTTSGTLTFNPGDPLSQTITVPVIGDMLDEADETFTVTLSGEVNTLLGTASADGTITDDDGSLTVTINQSAAQADPTTLSPILFTAVFTRAVTGFDSADVALGGTANPILVAVADTGDQMTYTITVSGMTAYGTVTAAIPAGVATDSGGNANTASTSTDNTVTFNAVVVATPVGPSAADHARAQAPLCVDLDGSTNPIIRANIPAGTVTGGSVFCRVIAENGRFRLSENPGEVGNPAVLNRGVIQAVDVFGLLNSGASQPRFNAAVEVCLQGSGAMLYLDATTAPRVLSELPVWTQGGYVCATIPSAGTVILVSGSPSAVAPVPVNGTPLTGCSVKTRAILNLRAAPDGAVLRQIPFDVTLTATQRQGGWFNVDYLGTAGWLSAQYVTPLGDCGQ